MHGNDAVRVTLRLSRRAKPGRLRGMRRDTCVLVSILAAAIGCGGGKGASPVDAAGRRCAGRSRRRRRRRPGRQRRQRCRRCVAPLEHVTSVFPAKDGTAVCTDAPLRLFFDMPPMTGAGGLGAGVRRGQPDDAGRQLRHRGAADVSGDRRAQLLLQADHHQRQRGVHLPAQGAEAGRDLLRHHRSGRVHDGPRRAADRRRHGHRRPGGSRSGARRPPPAPAGSRSPPTARATSAPCRARSTTSRPATRRRSRSASRPARIARSSRSRPNTRSPCTARTGTRRSSPTRTTPRLQIPPGSTASMGTKWRAMFGVDGSNDLRHREHHAVEPEPAAVDQRAVGDAAHRGRRPDDRAQRDDQGVAGHAADVRAGLHREQHHRGQRRLRLGQRRRLLRSLRDQGRRAQGLQRPGAQRDRRDGLRVRRLQSDGGSGHHGARPGAHQQEQPCRRLRWSRTSTARWARTSIRSAG